MNITVSFEVESKAALVEILTTGKAHSLLDYTIKDFVFHKTIDEIKKDYFACHDNLVDAVRNAIQGKLSIASAKDLLDEINQDY